MPKILKMYSFEEIARARKEGFLDAVQVLRDVKISETGLVEIAKAYEVIMLREYYRPVDDGDSE